MCIDWLCLRSEFTLAEIEHFVDPKEKNHPKFESVRNHELLLYTREAQLGSRRLVKMKIGDAVDQGIVDNQTLGYYMTRVDHFLVTAGVKRLRFRQHKAKEMAHYAQDCWDAEILTTFVRRVHNLLDRWMEMDWIGLDWIGLDWIGLDWIGLDWIGLDWIGLDWIGLEMDWRWIGLFD
jgi:hypothetical protein